MSKAAMLLSAGLILSLAFNLWLLASAPSEPRPPAQASTPLKAQPAACVEAVAPVRKRATCAQCETDLSACRTQSWRLAADLIAKDNKGKMQPQAETIAARTQRMMCKIALEHLDDPWVRKPPDLSARLNELRTLDFEARQARRCTIAREVLRGHWAQQQSKIEEILLSLEAPKIQEEWYADKTRDIASTLALNERERAELAHEYRAAMRSHMEAYQKIIAARPLDHASIVERIEAHLKTEDALVRRLYGEDAQAHFRAAQSQGRTSLLAMLKQYAGR